jgi:hypothetical protein
MDRSLEQTDTHICLINISVRNLQYVASRFRRLRNLALWKLINYYYLESFDVSVTVPLSIILAK